MMLLLVTTFQDHLANMCRGQLQWRSEHPPREGDYVEVPIPEPNGDVAMRLLRVDCSLQRQVRPAQNVPASRRDRGDALQVAIFCKTAAYQFRDFRMAEVRYLRDLGWYLDEGKHGLADMPDQPNNLPYEGRLPTTWLHGKEGGE